MNSTCETSYENGIYNAELLFGRILPYLVQGLLFGGIPPNIIHITDLKLWGSGKFHTLCVAFQ